MTSPSPVLPWKFDDLRALFINCTLKRSPERSHTQGLVDRSRAIMEKGSGANSVIGLADEGAGESPTGRGVLLRARAIAEFGR
jgi:hypothetical protein